MSALPLDPNNPLYRILNPGINIPGFGGMGNRGPSWLPPGGGFGGGMGGSPQPEVADAPQPAQQGWRGLLGNRDLALALLANSGYSPNKRGFGEILGTSMLQADQMKQGRSDDEFKRKYMEAQMAAMGGGAGRSPWGSIPVERATKESRAIFEKTGKYSDLEFEPEQKQMMDTAEMRNFKFRESLPDDASKRQFDDIIRQQYSFGDVGGVPSLRRTGPQPSITPVSTLPNEIAAIASKKAAESQAGAIGAGQGAIVAGIQKKGADAKTVMGTLDLADSLIDKATGSGVGSVIDKGAGLVGSSPEGARAIAQLQVLQAGLMLNMPRMEGPQSDRDVELYRQAAASLGDPTVPRETKKAAVKTIRDIQKQYADRAKQPFQLYAPGTPEGDQAVVTEFNNYLDKYAPKKAP